MRIANNKMNELNARIVRSQKGGRPQASVPVGNASEAFAPNARLSLTNFFNESLFMKLELLLSLFQKANGTESKQPGLPSMEKMRQLLKDLQGTKQYSPEALKNAVKIFSQAAKFRSIPAQLFSASGASSEVTKDIQVIREFFEHFQLYEALNRDYEGKTFLSFPLFNVCKPDRDIQVFLYVEDDSQGDIERVRFFSFRLDIPTEHMGRISLWGALQGKKVDIEVEVESEKVKEMIAQKEDMLEKGLKRNTYRLDKLLVKIRSRTGGAGQGGVEFIA